MAHPISLPTRVSAGICSPFFGRQCLLVFVVAVGMSSQRPASIYVRTVWPSSNDRQGLVCGCPNSPLGGISQACAQAPPFSARMPVCDGHAVSCPPFRSHILTFLLVSPESGTLVSAVTSGGTQTKRNPSVVEAGVGGKGVSLAASGDRALVPAWHSGSEGRARPGAEACPEQRVSNHPQGIPRGTCLLGPASL